ncbi:DUF2515 family protein [Oceanobacillus halotolerans]|uniref:DUF2515 family protein n=1 Tax=Oceanobacillus halotolerans TaxID=2663380 RepID=UPI0013DC53CF|nr:DUF2515 family protein [Oceanobacillus halotolerans]
MDKGKHHYLYYITKQTKRHNLDNISRTNAYFHFYLLFPEIKWAFLASLVSRNAGWNMTDLKLAPFHKILHQEERKRLFMTYERANWLIFSDAFPQLLIYQLSLQQHKPLFYLLEKFHVSQFMIKEWEYFWENQDQERLMIALIINEQNVIETPVIQNNYFQKRVFFQMPYRIQNWLLMNAVLLPTRSNSLYGRFVKDFTTLTNRITLGKEIASILFHPHYYESIFDFAVTTEHTGSRCDYEKYMGASLTKRVMVRTTYPPISHQDNIRKDWYLYRGIRQKWLQPCSLPKSYKDTGKRFYKKRNMLYAYYHLKNSLFT